MRRLSERVFLLAAMLGMTGLILTGCTSIDSDNVNTAGTAAVSQDNTQNTQEQNTQQPASGTADPAGGDSTSENASAASQTSAPQTDAQLPDADQDNITTYDEMSQAGDPPILSDDEEVDLEEESGEEDDYEIGQGAYVEGDDTEASAAQTGQADASGDQAVGAQEFSGTFSKADESESVVLSMDNDTVLSFSFAACGISGTAEADRTSAVYQGDDGYTITFAVSGDVLTVTVGGDDSASSPINGTYYRASGDETE